MELKTIIAEAFIETFIENAIVNIHDALQSKGIKPEEYEIYDIDTQTIGVRYQGSLFLKMDKSISFTSHSMTMTGKITIVAN